MRVAVPAEVKNSEYRVAMTPVGVNELVRHGHEVFVEAGAGHVDTGNTGAVRRGAWGP